MKHLKRHLVSYPEIHCTNLVVSVLVKCSSTRLPVLTLLQLHVCDNSVVVNSSSKINGKFCVHFNQNTLNTVSFLLQSMLFLVNFMSISPANSQQHIQEPREGPNTRRAILNHNIDIRVQNSVAVFLSVICQQIEKLEAIDGLCHLGQIYLMFQRSWKLQIQF